MEDKGTQFLSQKGRFLLGVSLFVLVLSAAGVYYLIFAPDLSWLSFWRQSAEPEVDVVETIVNPESENICMGCQPRWLDGVVVAAEAAQAFPVAVVIDNDVLARPQDGLSKASLVYEAPVEGGMTRFLAVFPADTDLSAVGPVRSARPYFVAWAEELGALFVHCGGSPEALDQVKTAGLYDLNEFYNGNYFWRDQSSVRVAPHNVLISADNWRSYLSKRGLQEKTAEAWLFKTEGEHASSSAEINIRFSSNFRATWRYQPDNNGYQRFFNGLESRDEGNIISAKNLIIHHLDSEVLDEVGRLHLALMGSGRAQVCIDGWCQEAAWRKSQTGRTHYYDSLGEEIKFNPGVTWIEVADNNTSVE